MVTYRGPQPRVVTAGGRPGGAAGAAGRATRSRRPERREMTEEERKKAREEACRGNSRRSRSDPRSHGRIHAVLRRLARRRRHQVPAQHAARVGGATNEEWTVGKVKVNPKIDPKKFEIER